MIKLRGTTPNQLDDLLGHPLTLSTVVLCIIATGVHWLAPLHVSPGLVGLDSATIGTPTSMWHGNLVPLLTSAAVHRDILHILFDLFWIAALGTVLEDTVHPVLWVLFVWSAACVSSAWQLGATGNAGIGASGVVYALLGLLWGGRAWKPTWRDASGGGRWRMALLWAAMCWVATTFGYANIANYAHIGGVLFGLGCGWLFTLPRLRSAGALLLVSTVTFAVMGIVFAPWNGHWLAVKGDDALNAHRYRSALGYYSASLKWGGYPPYVYFREGDVYSAIGDVERAQSAYQHASDLQQQTLGAGQ